MHFIPMILLCINQLVILVTFSQIFKSYKYIRVLEIFLGINLKTRIYLKKKIFFTNSNKVAIKNFR